MLLFLGTIGFMLIEGWPWFDGLYMTAISLTTVGFLEVHEMSHAGRFFTIILCFGGIFTLFYTATEIIRSIVSGELSSILGKEYMARSLESMKDHMIVCGFGRMGRFVCMEFERLRTPFVVIEVNENCIHDWNYEFGIPLIGDASSDDVLKRAGVERAKGLITVLSSDAANLYIVLSARLLNATVNIVSRAEEEVAEVKLRRVGANSVISPYLLGGHRIAQAVVRPRVVHFLEQAVRGESLELQIEEIEIDPKSQLAGQTLRQTRIHPDLGIIVVSIQKVNGEFQFNPHGDIVIEPGCVLIALGLRAQLDQLEERAKPCNS